MKIQEHYIAKTLLTYTLVVLLVWLSIYSFFNLLIELNSVGTASYSLLDALKYIVLQMPEIAYNQASPIILLGCVLGMGHLASTNQLIIFSVSGKSIIALSWLAVKNALFFITVIILIGELLAPFLSNYAERERSDALGHINISNSQEGFWIRDGNNFINVNKNIGGEIFSGITIIEVDSSNKIERVIKSDKASFDRNLLEMIDGEIFSINQENAFEAISFKERSTYNKTVSFDQDLIESLKKEPKELSTWTILKQIQFLSDNKLRSEVFEVELYKRLVKPVTLIAMVLLAMLFVFESSRDATLGRKIFFGVALGLSFEMISRVSGAMALSLDISPLLSSIIPVLSVMFISMILLTRKSMT